MQQRENIRIAVFCYLFFNAARANSNM